MSEYIKICVIEFTMQEIANLYEGIQSSEELEVIHVINPNNEQPITIVDLPGTYLREDLEMIKAEITNDHNVKVMNFDPMQDDQE